MTIFYTRVFNPGQGYSNRMEAVRAEFDLIAAAFAAMDTAKPYPWPMGMSPQSGAYTVVQADYAKVFECTGTFTLSLTSLASLSSGFWFILNNIGTGVVTVDPASAQTIDGAATGIAKPGCAYLIFPGNGSTWASIKISGTVREVLTGSGNWTCPMGVYSVRAQVQGPGGSGGRSSSSSRARPGSGGGMAVGTFKTTPATAYAYVVATGGAAVAVDGTAGNNGSASSTLNTGVVTLTGGAGAGGSSATTSGVTAGGTASNGDYNIPGGHGFLIGSSSTGSVGGGAPLGRGGVDATAAGGFGAGGFGSPSGVASDPGRDGTIILEY